MIPPAIVEPVIALSIAYVALENIVHRQAASGRWLVSFVFGLVHGFGFAGALLELGLPPSGILGSLLSFNLGVEAGQTLVVAALFPALLWFSRFAWERPAVTAMSAAVLIFALALAMEQPCSPRPSVDVTSHQRTDRQNSRWNAEPAAEGCRRQVHVRGKARRVSDAA